MVMLVTVRVLNRPTVLRFILQVAVFKKQPIVTFKQ